MRPTTFDPTDSHLCWIGWLLIGCVVLSSCSTSPPSSASVSHTESPSETDQLTRPLVISAASSTKDWVTDLVESFQSQSQGDFKLHFGPSSQLASQILAGAPVDLFLSASQQWANEVEKSGLAANQVHLFSNRLVLIVPLQNKANIESPEDLARPNVTKIALAGENVPCGVYATQALSSLHLFDQLKSQNKIVRGQDARITLSFVERAEADAGIVYATDALVHPGVKTVFEFDTAMHEPIAYVLVRLKQSNSSETATRFFQFLQSSDAQETYKRMGFIPYDGPKETSQ